MRFQKAGQCPAATRMTIRPDTCPSGAAAPPEIRFLASAARRFAPFVMLVALCALASTTPPASQSIVLRFSNAFAWWSSIVLAGAPFVTAGAVVAAALARLPHRLRRCAAIAIVAAPGCDCSGSGYASAFACEAPALAGFALAWSAAAGPAALFATHAVLGTRMLVARLAGAAVASTLTSAAWHVDARIGRRVALERVRTHGHPHVPAVSSTCGNVASALGALAMCAIVATAALACFGGALHALSSPLLSAVAGALLSPCSTSDAVLARVLVRDAPAQATFVIAAQTFDVRQLATLARVFGARRAALAGLAGVAGCAAAALLVR